MKKSLHPFFLLVIFFLAANVSASAQEVKIASFAISEKSDKISIDWKTDGSTATNYFAIQRSADGINYKTVALVMGPDPKQKDETFGAVDKTGNKKYYYRLVHIDTNGNEQITEARHLATP